MMPAYWVLGVVFVFIGTTGAIYQVLKDPELARSKDWHTRAALLAVCAIFLAWFAIHFVAISNKIRFQASNVGGHNPQVSVSGIQWDKHLTDLQIAVINPTGDELNKIDFTITPDLPVYRAAIETDISNCKLTVMPGGDVLTVGNMKNTSPTLSFSRMPLGDGYTYQDDRGTIYITLLTNKGYRLICDSIPSHFSLRLVFAVGQVDEENKEANKDLRNGQWAVSLFGVNGPVPPLLDSLGPRPRPDSVVIVGSYSRRFKPLTSNTTVLVSEPDWAKQQ